jgi:phage shock protein E
MTTVQRLTPDEFKTLSQQQPGVLLDVRTPGEYASGHVQESINYDFLGGEFADTLDKEKTYYLYCASGNRSGHAARMMLDAGFNSAYNVGGFSELAAAGLPTE